MRKLRAGSLQMVTFIIVVIALLLSSFLLLTHIHKQFRIQTDHIIETVRLADEGVSYSLSETSKNGDSIHIELFDEDYKSLKVKHGFWGVFEKVHSYSTIKNNKSQKVALIGQNKEKSALFLKDNGNPLVVVGNATIVGDAVLPERGVKSGSIQGHSYYGSNFINGNIATSQEFPALNKDLSKHLDDMFKIPLEEQQSVKTFNLNEVRVISNSFNNPLLFAYSQRKIVLSGKELKGHIVIRSDISITVNETSKLNDVLLIAPIIKINRNVIGSFQALASESIEVAEEVRLNYPSALILNNEADVQDKKGRQIIIKGKSKIKGVLLCLGKSSSKNYNVQLKIDKNALVEGEVFCEQNLELRGTVHGAVYTDNFIVKEGGTTYQNHLYNGVIDAHRLIAEYAGLTFNESPKEIIKWLY